MNRKKRLPRRSVSLPCLVEGLEVRWLPSSGAAYSPLLVNPLAYPAVRPNKPIMPFATPSKKATFIDPTVSVENGNSVVIGYQNFIGPYVNLNGRSGAIKIGNFSSVLDSATLVANPGLRQQMPLVLIGDQVVIGFGARVEGPSAIGGYGSSSKPTSIGANAVVDGAVIEPGAIVSPVARVGPGVTVPSGLRVLPGANVTTNLEASNPALGMVVPVTASDVATIESTLSENGLLAAGYATLYQGSSATGVNPGADRAITGIYNGNLAAILGANLQPGPGSARFEPARSGPEFLTPQQGLVGVRLSNFPARITGRVIINMRAWQAAHRLGRANAFRADEGQPITIGSIARTGRHVTINSPLGGTLTIGQHFRTGSKVVVLSGPSASARLGDNVTIDSGAVVVSSSIGSNSTVGQGAYLADSSFPADTVIPPQAIYVKNKLLGYVN